MPCVARPPCTFTVVPLEAIDVQWGGPAVGRKALAFPARRTIYIDPAFWASLRTVDGRAAILAHERAHIEGARCESCADRRGGEILKREGMEVPRDAARALAGRLDNRDGQRAADDLLEGFGWGKGFGVDEKTFPGRTDTGYRNGKPFAVELAEVRPDVWVAEEAAFSLASALLECQGAHCAPTSFNSAFRTMAEQEALYAKYQTGGPVAARPGYSNHQQGESVDLSFASDAARELAAGIFSRHGWERDVASERWHFTYGGKRRYFVAAAVAGGVVALLVAVAMVTK